MELCGLAVFLGSPLWHLACCRRSCGLILVRRVHQGKLFFVFSGAWIYFPNTFEIISSVP